MRIPRSSRAYVALRTMRNRALIAAKRLRNVHPTAYVHSTAKVSKDLVAAPYVYVGDSCRIPPLVSIGKYSMLAPKVSIVGDDHNWDMPGQPIQFTGRPAQHRTTIGEDAWIGYGAIILRGVTIGSGAVIGAGSVVTTDVPEYEVWAGVPARAIRARFTEPTGYERHEQMLARSTVEPSFVEPQAAADTFEVYRRSTRSARTVKVIGSDVRVLVVYDILPHYRLDVFRGIEDIDGLDVEFVSGSKSGDSSIATIPDRTLNKVHHVRNIEFGQFLWQSGLTRVLRKAKPDVVVFLGDSSYLSTWLGALFLRLRGRKVLFWTIGWHKPEAGVRRVYRVGFYRLAHKLLVYGDVGRRVGIEMGYPSDRMAVVYNSSSEPMSEMVEDAAALQHFRSLLPPCGGLVATAVIRLNASKRLDMIVEAAAILRERGRPVSVLLVGEGPERSRLEELAAALRVPLYLPGSAYSSERLRLVYSRTTVTVVPTRAGLTTLQSLKYGIPVITHDFEYEQMPESEAIVPGLTGDYYRYGSLEGLADTIGHWLSKQAADRDGTALHCRAAIVSRWSAHAQAEAIAGEILSISAGAGQMETAADGGRRPPGR